MTAPLTDNKYVLALWKVLDKLDPEEDDNVRADLIDEAIGLSDLDADAAAEWAAYR